MIQGLDPRSRNPSAFLFQTRDRHLVSAKGGILEVPLSLVQIHYGAEIEIQEEIKKSAAQPGATFQCWKIFRDLLERVSLERREGEAAWCLEDANGIFLRGRLFAIRFYLGNQER